MNEFSCPKCPKTFATSMSLYSHAKAKHGRKVANEFYVAPDHEPSMGEELAHAQIAWEANRTPPPSWLRNMFPEAFQ